MDLSGINTVGGGGFADPPVRPWLDVEGKPINAHGGGLLFHGGRAYWYGECRPEGPASLNARIGVAVYVSDDLVHWENGGVCLPVSEDPDHPMAPGCKIERPKVLFNAHTGQFVMWWHHDLKGRGHASALAGVAVSDSPVGPFRLHRVQRANLGFWPLNALPEQKVAMVSEATRCSKFGGGPGEGADAHNVLARDYPVGQMVRDMTLFQDDDGTAYHIFASEDNGTIHMAELTPDFLDHSGRYIRAFEGRWMEAPCVFKRNGSFGFLASGCTSWRPNAARSGGAAAMFGPWTEWENPCRGVNPENGVGPELTFGGQSTCVFQIPGEDRYYAMFDLWNPEDLHESRYLWLPLRWEGDRFFIEFA